MKMIRSGIMIRMEVRIVFVSWDFVMRGGILMLGEGIIFSFLLF